MIEQVQVSGMGASKILKCLYDIVFQLFEFLKYVIPGHDLNSVWRRGKTQMYENVHTQLK